ncbi:superoxide dismutase [Lanmaoa asiatica]|nr:superoxide dismutase [Lanmaoa asiatica]
MVRRVKCIEGANKRAPESSGLDLGNSLDLGPRAPVNFPTVPRNHINGRAKVERHFDQVLTGEKKSNKPIILTGVLTAAAIFVLYHLFSKGSEVEQVRKAVTALKGSSSVYGTVTFEQSTRDGPVIVSGTVQNLDPSSFRGFHIHELGDLSVGCFSTGSHFNPFKEVHGARTDSTRHVGDLGNIASDEHGMAIFSFTDDVISLNGPKSIVGCGEDDLGRGGNEDSLVTGNAGGRAACGVIGRG